MKLTVILCVVFQISVLAKAQNVSLHFKNRPLSEVLNHLAKQADIGIFYGESVIRVSKPVTVSIKDLPFLEALKICLHGQLLTFKELEDRVIIIEPSLSEINELPRISIDTTGEIEFTGQVMDEKGVVLPGATVRILTLARGTQTDANGKFRLKGNSANRKLLITYTGFKNETVEGGVQPVIIYLKAAAAQLDKVVVQGYGLTTQRLATGNISTVTAQEIERQPVANVMQALQGRVAGLVISQTSGFASAPFKAEIRGRTSISDGVSEPLIIVDGVPLTVLNTSSGGGYATGSTGFVQNGFLTPANGQSPLYSISPDDIESVSVLKDAEATAIYGSRGGKGVILITTKKGRPGKTAIDGSLTHGVSFVKNFYEMLSTREYIDLRREAFINSGEEATPTNAYDYLVWDTTRETNWQKTFWGKAAQTSQYKLAVSGGDKYNNYRISGGYDRSTQLNTFSGFDERVSFSTNMGHKTLDNKLGIELTALYTYSKNENIALGGGVDLPPTAPPIFKDDGQLNFSGWEPVSYLFTFGPVRQPYVGRTRFLNSNLSVSYHIIKGLKASLSVGYSNHNLQQNFKLPIASQNPAFTPMGSSYFGNNTGNRTIYEPMLEYKSSVGKGTLTTIVGATYQYVNQSGNTVNGDGYTNDNLLGSISNAAIVSGKDNVGEYKYSAAFGRLNYNLLDRYLITLTGRRDGSSRFGAEHRYGSFGAVGAAWIFSQERFLEKAKKAISFGKIRVSYGVTGSDNISDYLYLTRWTSNNANYLGTGVYQPVGHANPDLRWQSDRKLEAALNLGFTSDRILLDLVWYQNRSGNQLLSYKLPFATGFRDVMSNFPAVVQNSGFEGGVNVVVVKRSDFEITFSGTIGINRNKLISFPGIESTPYANFLVVGNTLNQVKLLKLLGVNKMNGLYEYEDVIKDGEISVFPGPTDDRTFYDLNIKCDGGFGFDVRYRSFQASMRFNFRNGIGTNALYTSQWLGAPVNFPRETLKRWRQPGDDAPYARAIISPDKSDNLFTYSTGKYTDASFIRLANLFISYSPKTLSNWAKLKNLKFYLRGQNLLLFTKYKGSDPEVQGFGFLPPLTGIDGGLSISL
ncbi:SusC/RagA family TonB-linked outer membrane protein [Chitinophaga pollutisoli]|uniref:SusC/RagA family TonB-linked outer membrane protein n=1 Tax=Chitinophaga pollutisoli TaxID=3133966 RepID=A0ABZ2YR63_9BACT